VNAETGGLGRPTKRQFEKKKEKKNGNLSNLRNSRRR
jgi:hypothetical protein